MLNSVVIMGRLGFDPELRKTAAGVSVTSLRIACDRSYVNADGTRETDWFDVVCWRGTADFACKYLSKGRQIVAIGSLQTREWTDKEGSKRYSTEIIADSVYFADSRKEDA